LLEDLESVYAAYGGTLFSLARHILGKSDDAQDCVHDVLLRVWRRPDAFQPERGSLRSYLMTCVRNEALTRMRNDKRHRAIERREAEATPFTYEFEISDASRSAALRRALDALPKEQRLALALAYAGHLTHREVAQRLQLPLGTVKSRIALALRRLKSALGPQETAV
jgi:RNA polymerase sigma-70 factor (ECF subfamily)